MMNLNMKAVSLVSLVLGTGLFMTGCASTGNVTPQYVAPSTYQSYDCTALTQEYTRLGNYIQQAQSSASSSGITTTGIGIGMSAGRWGISPNINVGLGRNRSSQANNAKLSRLQGERDAIVQSARMKNCTFATNLKVYGE